ncbi:MULTISPECIES: hypothetical protein [Niastella]|uniref:Uncharacterized protein n=1 Tax=Niastella soli TaxID=2821487 RepID=A0ABS3YYP3_9BACT|nr:hypothetical protein [Niastella soli]MBO9203040.1 hypothetical protein [Niastella soli]
MNLKSFEKGLRKELNKWFSEKGFAVFEELGFTYFKKQEGYTDYVSIRLGGKAYLHELYAQVSMGRKIASIESYWEEYADLLGIQGGMRYTMNIDQLDERGVSQLAITVKDDDTEAVAKARDYIIQTFENLLYPQAELLTDIKELDRLHNDVPDTRRYGSIEKWYRRMIIAKLAGNENYKKILNIYLTMHNEGLQEEPGNKDFYEKRIFVANELDKKLNNVLPLNDPKAIV